jgi:hypothetical protein
VTIRMTTLLTLNDSTHSVIARLLNVHRLTSGFTKSGSLWLL